MGRVKAATVLERSNRKERIRLFSDLWMDGLFTENKQKGEKQMSGDLIERNEAILNHCILECRKAPDGCEVDCAHYHLFENIPAVEKRKKGKWVPTKIRYATPGGDPVWECSECGKGIHTYGIEHSSYGRDVSDGQWVSCPNCGAEME